MNALTIRNLEKRYPNGVYALRGIDLDVAEGEFFALLGPNGAGKSTAIGIIASLVNKTAGEVSVFGHDLDTDLAGAKASIGLVPQEFNFNQFETVIQIVLNQAGYYGIPRSRARERAERYLKQLGLWEKRDVVSRELSGGMKRRLMIARALIHEPRLLILDEPTAGVDIEIRRSMWRFLEDINRRGISIILTTHYLEEAESLCSTVAVINHGRIVEYGTVSELLHKLNYETFVLNVRGGVTGLNPIEGYSMTPRLDGALEVEVPRDTGINRLFEALSEQGVEVLSMRNKTNRLEEFFMRLVEDQRRDAA
ncbi:ABC transporter ATP-binding protein [Halofilum ochraceum]|uniref:ABC transporter ATP-binding protein n=1 Tax=Halofilum ochraceum TaxID=1611323 RepID=UPI0008334336|nr:ABC transporter ATP-binding protein [Halofilum ochraceum]